MHDLPRADFFWERNRVGDDDLGDRTEVDELHRVLIERAVGGTDDDLIRSLFQQSERQHTHMNSRV